MKRYVVTGAVAFRPREWIKWHLLSRFNGSPTHYFCPSNIKLSCGEALFSLAGLFCEIDRSHGLLIMTVLASSFTLSLNGDTDGICDADIVVISVMWADVIGGFESQRVRFRVPGQHHGGALPGSDQCVRQWRGEQRAEAQPMVRPHQGLPLILSPLESAPSCVSPPLISLCRNGIMHCKCGACHCLCSLQWILIVGL